MFFFAVLLRYGTFYTGLVLRAVLLSKLFLHSFHCKAATRELSQPLNSSFGLPLAALAALEGCRCVRKRGFGKRHRRHRRLHRLEGLGCAQQGILGSFQSHAQISQGDTTSRAWSGRGHSSRSRRSRSFTLPRRNLQPSFHCRIPQHSVLQRSGDHVRTHKDENTSRVGQQIETHGTQISHQTSGSIKCL